MTTPNKTGAHAPKVKPLEWSEHPGNYPEWRAHGQEFTASIDKSRTESRTLCFGKFPLFINGVWDGKQHKTLKAAKAAAEADYERRVLSALDLDPNRELIATLYRALKWYGEQAEAAARHTIVINETALLAVVQVLSLDGGTRANRALSLARDTVSEKEDE